MVREGTLGRAGKVRETGLSPNSTPIEQLAAPYRARGFIEVGEDGYDHVVIQFRRATAPTTAAISPMQRNGSMHISMNAASATSTGTTAANAPTTAGSSSTSSRESRTASWERWPPWPPYARSEDATRATIAYRTADADEWTLRYERSARKLPGPFSL